MRTKSLLLLLSLGFLCFQSCTEKAIGDHEIMIFNDEPMNFNPDENCLNINDDIIKVHEGRILLKKVKLPKYHKDVKVNAEVQIVSAGDPWDKTGSFFLIPASSEINFLLENDKFEQLYAENTNSDLFPGITPEKGYSPAVEILRFMTPFGVGHFSNDSTILKRKPVYIPKWADKVVWNEDVTQLVSELEGEVWIGAFVDVWTPTGYKITAKLSFEESKAIKYPKVETKVIPLANTVQYIKPQKLYDGFNRHDLEYQFEIPKGYKSAKLYYITTGHGGHSGGDEFVEKENIVSINGEALYQDVPWRDDCASFRRFNPHSGVWTAKRIARTGNLRTGDTKETEIDEFTASSDYSRSNWCPGSKVSPFVMDIPNFNIGKNTISISIPEAQPIIGDKANHWNVSAYIVLTK
ncbi:MAG: peptide-N-glycosidase F-related protein [Mangrovibacterium sp.]